MGGGLQQGNQERFVRMQSISRGKVRGDSVGAVSFRVADGFA